ncbi:DUF3592 domain-containing protein [Allonocardiopsis opalescens]|uniref:Uncharacterized protein DUF3592 n=1 Tax=Allonocardiopsis opalescens TaxID=1144618 RepID=A0A2T0PW65_9ACTN|nr:DUF3592 domain-containing protein [Allonocardiopsis opalescens]PRX95771.1 uncharacterized protein DUF3592 [Allonocardiopsis opalescens]
MMNARARRVPMVIGTVSAGVAAAILLVMGVIFTAVGGIDYTSYTGRAEAVVVEVITERNTVGSGSDRRSRVDTDTYVGYTAEGQEFGRVLLNGLNPDSYAEGQSLTVAYDPANPGSPVTVASTEPGAMDTFRWVGIALLVAGGVVAVVAVVLIVKLVSGRRARPSGPAPGPYGYQPQGYPPPPHN